MSCAIVGDSIAVGIHQYHQECVQYAKVGISAKGWTLKYPNDVQADKVLISLGSNGGDKNSLALARLKINSNHVTWVMPYKAPKGVKSAILRLVIAYQDKVIFFVNTKDGVHPKSYKSLAVKF